MTTKGTIDNILSCIERNFCKSNGSKSNGGNILPITTNNDSTRCRDFDFNKVNCLKQNYPRKQKLAVITPYFERNDTICITIVECNNEIVCDMV
jgi:hypothetical protein